MKDSEANQSEARDSRKNSSQIYELDGTACKITGYSISYSRTALVYVFYVLTCGLLRLVFHWCPRWMLRSTHTVCPLSDAQKVLIKDSAGVYYALSVMISIIDSHSGVVLDTYSAYKFKRLYPDVSRGQIKESHRMVYFFYKRLKYIWDEDQNQFCVLSEFGEQPYAKLFPVRPLPETVVSTRRAFYEANEIAIHLTPITKVLLSECLNPFYCFQAFSCTLWFIEDYWMYASCILVMSAISLCTQVYETRRNEVALKKTICGSAILTVCREVNGTVEFQDVDSTELVPGDLIEIPRKGCMMHCDAFVLTGNCIVNESTLTGESVPVTKTPLPDRQRRDDAFNIRSLARHVLFDGTSVIQTRNYANERVMAVVVRTGFRTAKGELVRSILYPKPMKFKFAQDALKFVAALGGLSVLGFAVSVFLMHRSGVETGRIVLRALDLITIVVPPALPVAMTVAIVFAQRRLRGHNIYCINPSAINVCGVINVACFDKTGTLTEDGMDLWGVVPNNQGNFGEPQMNPSEFEHGPLLEAMASCHSLTRIEGVLSGDPLDLKMFQSTKWEFLEEVSEDHCKFEMAVPAIVRPEIKGSLTNVTLDSTIEPDMIPYEIGILRQFPFTSSLQRMSVIARVLNSSHFSVYTKGAPEMLETLCRRDTLPSDYQSVLLEYTREGYRVLALAWRPLKVSYTKVLRIPRERAEQDLLFLGFLVMENRLKPETAPAIQVLRNANIRPVMVTGDNMLTAVSVARDCEIIDELDRIIIVSAKPPPKSNSADVAFNGVSDAAGDVMNPVDPTGFAQQQQQHAPFLISLGQLDRIWPTGSSEPYGFTVTRDHPLVEFHYAEDLHKPVTEVTVTSDGVNGWRNQRVRRRRSDGLFSAHGHGKSLFSRWTNCFRKPSDSQPSYGAVPTTALTGSAGVAGSTVTPEIGGAQTYGESAPPWRASGTNHRVTIRMIDRPDFHLAISGKTWGVIKEHYPWLIPKLVVKGTVFARFSPDQKTQLIEALQAVGYFVAMCGDGANDCGALKAAHAGISLSEAEASVASPFTSKRQHIGCVPTLISQGRCALVTSFGTFKFMSGYSLVQFFTTVLLYTLGSTITDGQFLFIDLLLITTLSVTYGYTRAYPRLSVEPPSMHLLSTITFMSMGFQLLVNCTLQVVCFIWVRVQPWYIPLYDISYAYELKNYESTVVFIVSVYQYIILAIVFSKGAPYRRSIFTNYFFICNLIGCTVVTLYVTTYPADPILNLLAMVRIPSIRFILILHGVVLANFLACYILELIVDGVSFRRRLLHIRRALFPRHVQIKDYERIREEIDRLAGSWPPIIRSASVQALPRELFHDGDDFTAQNSDGRVRKRTVSGASSDSEDELVSPVQTDFPTETALLQSSPSTEQHANMEFTVGGTAGADPAWKSSRRRRINSGKLRRPKSLTELHWESNLSGRPAITTSKADEPGEDVFAPESEISFQPVYPTSSLRRNILVDKRKRSQSTGPCADPVYLPVRGHWTGHDRAAVKKI